MNQEERKQKIDSILEGVKRHGRMTGNGIPIELWIDAQDGKPGDPAFEEWLKCCTEAVDDYEAMTGKKDRDSVFAEYVRLPNMYANMDGGKEIFNNKKD